MPVHADIPLIDAVILDSYDDKANPYGVKAPGSSASADPALRS